VSDAHPELSVVLPCYNEGKGLEQLLDGYAAVIGGLPAEIILVDNGSSDDTPERLAELLPRYPFARGFRVLANKGYGDGIMQGLRAARGTFLAWSHADLQCPPVM
jgi:glycosyltransferase involved in cell wall biosynthesis